MSIESITNKSANVVLSSKTAAKQPVAVKDNTVSATETDTVKLTSTAQEIKSSSAGVEPVVNEDRVSAVKAAVQAGQYSISAERVAEKIMQFEDKLPNST